MRFTGQFIGAKLDLGAYRARMESYLKEKLCEATQAWVSGVTGRVPIWSGMSQASLLEVVELIGGQLVITPKAKSRIQQGRALGTAEPKFGPNDFTITITTDVPHYNVQEYTYVGISKSAPWLSLKNGELFARPILDSTLLPQPYIKPVKIKKI